MSFIQCKQAKAIIATKHKLIGFIIFNVKCICMHTFVVTQDLKGQYDGRKPLRFRYYFTDRKKDIFCFCSIYCKQIMYTATCLGSNGVTFQVFRKYSIGWEKSNAKIYLSKQTLEK